jgi:hypothetical protein
LIRLHPQGAKDPHQWVELEINGGGLGLQVSSMARVCGQLSSLLSSVEQLDILSKYDYPTSQVNVDDNTQWLELFQPFTAIRTLRISHKWQSFIMSTLQSLTAALPVLNSIHLEVYQPYESEQQVALPFITACQYSGHPVAIQRLEGPRMTWDS